MQFLPPTSKVEFAGGKPLECNEIFDLLNEKGFFKTRIFQTPPLRRRARSTRRAAGALRNTLAFIQQDFQFHKIIVNQLKSLDGIYGELWALHPVKLHVLNMVLNKTHDI